ncbi:Putative mycofactocin biosynthesis transcriptional regulator MftR [bacterium HR26]|nr:Putative mycofactocin biosynthesis transcriptional regulator MftR [bacterium HR26]
MTVPGGSSGPSLRERKKAQTRRAIQEHALRLFSAKGYEATTVQEIAAAAGVSHMTFFRYFPTKEDVILTDDYDRLIVEQLAARPADEPIVDKIRGALKAGLQRVYAADREALLARTRLILRTPALRARLWEQQAATERLIARALAAGSGQEEDNLRLRVAVAACLAAVTTAVLVWAENEGADELPALIDQALSALRQELSGTDG